MLPNTLEVDTLLFLCSYVIIVSPVLQDLRPYTKNTTEECPYIIHASHLLRWFYVMQNSFVNCLGLCSSESARDIVTHIIRYAYGIVGLQEPLKVEKIQCHEFGNLLAKLQHNLSACLYSFISHSHFIQHCRSIDDRWRQKASFQLDGHYSKPDYIIIMIHWKASSDSYRFFLLPFDRRALVIRRRIDDLIASLCGLYVL